MGTGSLGLRPIAILLAFLFLDGGVADKFPRRKLDSQDEFWFHFVTRPDIQAPKWTVRNLDESAITPGYWFVSPYENLHQEKQAKNWVGPYIYDGDGELIWAGTPTMGYYNFYDFKVVNFNGSDVLSGISTQHNGGVFFDSHYEFIKSMSWTEDWQLSNMHEFNVVDNGTRAVATTRNRHTMLSEELSKTIGYNGRCEVKADGVKEIDITVDPAKVLFEWIGVEHIPLKEAVRKPEKTESRCGDDWDLHHFNSVDKFLDGDYLVSSREMSTIFRISHIDGSIKWRIGGRQSDFKMDEHAQFAMQHIPRIVEETSTHVRISLLDNAVNWLDVQPPPHRYSRGIVIELDTRAMTAKLVQEAIHPTKGHTGSRGSNQLLPNGNLFVCWADRTRVTEHDPNGKLIMHSNLVRDHPYNMPSYRGYKFPWVGRPKYPPNVHSAAFVLGPERNRTMTMTSVSWNGATEVASWRLYWSNELGSDLKVINETTRRGFETEIWYYGFAEHVVVEALDRADQPLGRSEVVPTLAPVEASPGVPESVLEYTPIPPPPPPPPEPEVSWIDYLLANQMSTFIAGFATCAAVWCVIRIMSGLKKKPWWRKGSKYLPLDAKNKEVLFGPDEEELGADEDLELEER